MPQRELIGESPAFREVLDRATRMAASTARVLITGETGTGKENIAALLHHQSARAHMPFVAVNCAALPAALIESELFGHAKGAFTGAAATHEGLVAAASGGTLFLDEIAELDLPLQAKLLRFLETGIFRKLGATETEQSNVRILSATHCDLKSRAARGEFREDLYYRLSVLTLDMPPLRTRHGDIPLLALHFIKQFAADEGKNFAALEDEAAQLLSRYPWPGNIREMQNALHQAVVLNAGPVVTAAMLQDILHPAADTAANNIVPITGGTADKPKPLWQAEKDAIDAALRYCSGNVPRAAALLEISPSTLYRRRDSFPDISAR